MESKQARIKYYPVCLNINGKHCVVVGGGKVAAQKVRVLLDFGAYVTVISPVVCEDLELLAKSRLVHILFKEFATEDLENTALVIAATEKSEVNEQVSTEARRLRVLVNVADNAAQSDFILPATFSRGELLIAVSTSGQSPALARKIRDRLENSFGREYEMLVDLIADVRSELRNLKIQPNKEDWQKAIDLDLLIKLLKNGEYEKAKTALISLLTDIRNV